MYTTSVRACGAAFGSCSQRTGSMLKHTAVGTPGSDSPDLRQYTGKQGAVNPENTAATNREKVVAVQP